jgi:hypothetical protein
MNTPQRNIIVCARPGSTPSWLHHPVVQMSSLGSNGTPDRPPPSDELHASSA